MLPSIRLTLLLTQPLQQHDIALIYALVSFTGTIAVLRFVEYNVEQSRADGVDGSVAPALHTDESPEGATS